MLFKTSPEHANKRTMDYSVFIKHVISSVNIKRHAITFKLMFILVFLIIFSCLVLTSCGGDKRTKSTQKFIDEIKSRPQKKIEALPEVKPVKTVKYSSQDLRSPFKPEKKLVKSSGLSPDVSRPKEELEAYPLDSLRMVGTITQDQREWALILASNKSVYKVTIGSHIGQNYGRIIAISKDRVEIVETVPDGLGDWKERDVYLSLVE